MYKRRAIESIEIKAEMRLMLEMVLDLSLSTCVLLATRHFTFWLIAFAGIHFAPQLGD
jgi:hypothetical protein